MKSVDNTSMVKRLKVVSVHGDKEREKSKVDANRARYFISVLKRGRNDYNDDAK